MTRLVDGLITYRILRLLATPVEESDAYKLGIINKDGIRIKHPITTQELDAYSILNRFVFKVQKALMKSPDKFAHRLLTFAAALAILREYKEEEDDIEVLLEVYIQDEAVIAESKLLERNLISFKNFIGEEMAANCASGGSIDGIGVGAKGEPGIKRKTKKSLIRRGVNNV